MGAPLPGEIDGGVGERMADALAAETRAGDEAGHGPDTVVGLVLGSARRGDSTQTHIGGGRLDRAPAGGLARRVRLRGRSYAPRGGRSACARAAGRHVARREPTSARSPIAARGS